MNKVAIFGGPDCIWCKRAVNLATERELEFEYFDVSEAQHKETLRKLKPDVKTIPQIWWGDRYIGGFESFASEIENTIGGYGESKL